MNVLSCGRQLEARFLSYAGALVTPLRENDQLIAQSIDIVIASSDFIKEILFPELNPVDGCQGFPMDVQG